MRPTWFPRISLCNNQLHTQIWLVNCNFLTRNGLHEDCVMSRKWIPQELAMHVCNVIEGRGICKNHVRYINSFPPSTERNCKCNRSIRGFQERKAPINTLHPNKYRVHVKGVVLCERTCFCVLSTFLLSAFYETLPSKNPSKNLGFTRAPYRRLLTTLLKALAFKEPAKNPSKKRVVAWPWCAP